MPDGESDPLSPNRRRRRAVALRLEGSTLAETRRRTGLSAPTIIAACKAYQRGGWEAVDAAPRGRPRGQGRRIDPALEARLRAALAATDPEDAPGAPALWTLAALRAWLHATHDISLSATAIIAHAARWGYAPPRVEEHARHSAPQWHAATLPGIVAAARAAATPVQWVGETPLPEGGRTLLYAHGPRGRLQWQVVAAPATATAVIDFLERLVGTRPATLISGIPGLQRSAELRDWLQAQGARVAWHPIDTPDTRPYSQPPDRTADRPPSAARRPAVTLTHLQRLEAESIHIMREVVAEAENPVMLYSVGKDSAVMLHLARKAFYPAPPPFPLLHVDTRWKFREMYAFRDRMAKECGMDLIVHINPDGVAKNINPFTHGSALHTDIMKTEGLKQALDKYGFDAAFGGARRDEEKSRAKERIFSFRSAQHRWDPKAQRPELWRLYNARKHKGESIRVFPLSNWTELDIWQYIYLENIPIVPLYYAAPRPVVERDGALIMVDDDRMPLKKGEVPMQRTVRFRTLGCYPLTGAVESTADTLPAIIQEMLLTRTSERQGRVIDHDAAASMEKKKQEGYF